VLKLRRKKKGSGEKKKGSGVFFVLREEKGVGSLFRFECLKRLPTPFFAGSDGTAYYTTDHYHTFTPTK